MRILAAAGGPAVLELRDVELRLLVSTWRLERMTVYPQRRRTNREDVLREVATIGVKLDSAGLRQRGPVMVWNLLDPEHFAGDEHCPPSNLLENTVDLVAPGAVVASIAVYCSRDDKGAQHFEWYLDHNAPIPPRTNER